MTPGPKLKFAQPPTNQLLEKICTFFSTEIFESFDKEDFVRTCQFHQRLTCHWMEDDKGHLLGVKVGYPKNPEHFYSWLGGVSSISRGLGIGKQLMKEQHEWCKKSGYKVISMKTMNKWRAMLHLSLDSGFEIVGTHQDSKGHTKIILVKDLTKNS